MTKKELKKAKVNIRSGYYHGSYCIFEVNVEMPSEVLAKDGKPYMATKTLARIDTKHIEDYLSKRVRGGLFTFDDNKGRKYQYITMK